jgi:hypothetical protein
MSVQHANRGVVKKDLQLYYNREFPKSFRGQATTNIAYATNSFLNSNSNWWVNSGNTVFNDNDTTIDKPVILNVDTSNLRIFSSTVTVVGNQQLGSSIIPISGSTQYSMSIYYWFSGGSMQAPPYVRANINNNELAYFGYNGDTNYLNWPRRTWIRLTATFTTQANETGVYMSSYTGDTAGEKLAYFGYQIEQKAYVTPLVLGSRTANTVAAGGGLLDMSGNNVNVSLSNVAFDSGGYYFTTAGSNYINTGITTLPSNTQLTIDVWTKPTSTTQTKTLVSKWGSGSQSNYCFLLFLNWFAQGNIYFLVGNSAGTNYSLHSIAHNLSTSVYINYTVVYDNGYVSWYRNGVFIQTDTNGSPLLKSVTTAITIGADYDGGNPDTLTRSYDGTIPNVRLYSKALTAAEVSQNFNATRKTYGI